MGFPIMCRMEIIEILGASSQLGMIGEMLDDPIGILKKMLPDGR